jgi:hypothetical protein
MIHFLNGVSIGGNPQITKTKFGIKILNDLGLNIELSNNIWDSFNNIK